MYVFQNQIALRFTWWHRKPDKKCSHRSRLLFSKSCEREWDFSKGNLDKWRESNSGV